MYDTILVGTDGSESANRAVEKGLYHAEQSAAELHAITVVNTRRYGEPSLSSTELVLNELEQRANNQLEKIRELAQNRNVDVVTDHFHGEPSREIIQYADKADADLIILGYQGRTHEGSRIGSTADRVVHGTDRPVLLV